MRYRLRTLLIAVALGPPLLAGILSLIAWGWFEWKMHTPAELDAVRNEEKYPNPSG